MALREQLRQTFAKRLHFSPTDQEAVYLPDLGGGVKVITAILRGIQAFLATSGMMTMAVGILGVANMMFLAVTERTREIGVRLAIGATPQRIKQQFLLEGLMLVVLGALAGLLFAYLAVELLKHFGLPMWLGGSRHYQYKCADFYVRNRCFGSGRGLFSSPTRRSVRTCYRLE